MPVCKAEAHRALELLEDYYSRLDDTEEKELKAAIERVIKIFKSRLFQVKNETYKGAIRIVQAYPTIYIPPLLELFWGLTPSLELKGTATMAGH